jgi:hypothetical protein
MGADLAPALLEVSLEPAPVAAKEFDGVNSGDEEGGGAAAFWELFFVCWDLYSSICSCSAFPPFSAATDPTLHASFAPFLPTNQAVCAAKLEEMERTFHAAWRAVHGSGEVQWEASAAVSPNPEVFWTVW